MIERSGAISGWGGYVAAFADIDPNTEEPRRSPLSLLPLDFHGTFTEAVGGIRAFTLRVAPSANPAVGIGEHPAVGAFGSVKPILDGGVQLTFAEFQLLLALATAGKPLSVTLTIQKPSIGGALIFAAVFHSDPTQTIDTGVHSA